jgi:hypothetical protein
MAFTGELAGYGDRVRLHPQDTHGLEVDHGDYVLTDREKAANDCMMVCVSRACGKRLVLGL